METTVKLVNNNQAANKKPETSKIMIDLQGNRIKLEKISEKRIEIKIEKVEKIINRTNEEPIDLTLSPNVARKFKSEDSGFETDSEGSQTTQPEYASVSPNCTSITLAHIMRAERFLDSASKKKGRRKKPSEEPEEPLHTIELPVNTFFANPDYFQNVDNKQIEVLKAAKSLFSKRTRTLYHWMYPNAPRAQLKAAVATSWDTLGMQEKEFYISQVLGRFGFPQCSLMVNPQLETIRNMSSLPPLDLSAPNQTHEETRNAVCSLLMSENSGNWNSANSFGSSCTPPHAQRLNRKRRRLGRPPGSKNRKQVKDEDCGSKEITHETNGEEFQDDPELSREFEQFRWALHLNDNTPKH